MDCAECLCPHALNLRSSAFSTRSFRDGLNLRATSSRSRPPARLMPSPLWSRSSPRTSPRFPAHSPAQSAWPRPAYYGPALQIDFTGPRRSPACCCLAYRYGLSSGTLSTMPWRERGGRLCGPGVFDMKAESSRLSLPFEPCSPRAFACALTLLLVPDEEIGSPASRSLTSAWPVPPARAGAGTAAGVIGACKSSRKGVARYTLQVHGVAAHAGLDFERGASAIVEAAHQVLSISALSRPEKGSLSIRSYLGRHTIKRGGDSAKLWWMSGSSLHRRPRGGC